MMIIRIILAFIAIVLSGSEGSAFASRRVNTQGCHSSLRHCHQAF